MRIVRKVPDLVEYLTVPATGLLTDKHHGVLVAGVKLCTELCQSNDLALEHFRKVCVYAYLKDYAIFLYVCISWLFIDECFLLFRKSILFDMPRVFFANLENVMIILNLSICVPVCAACDDNGPGVEKPGGQWLCS